MGSLLTSFRRASRVRSRIIYKNESVAASQVNMRSKNILSCDLGRVHRQPESVRYICSSSNYTHEHGATFVIAELIDRLSNAGFRYVDFGPSASDQKFSKGVSFFKEGLGAAGQCRDRWLWEAK